MHVTQRLTYRSTDRSVFTRDGTASVSSIIVCRCGFRIHQFRKRISSIICIHIEFDSISPRRRAGRPRVPDET